MKTFVEFIAESFPKTQFNEHGDISIPGGKEVLEYIVEKLRKDTSWIISPIHERSFYGWEMIIKIKRKYLVVIQQSDKWLILFDEMFSLKKFITGRNKEEMEGIYDILDSILNTDNKFQDTKWFTKFEYEGKS